jgi:hypothetical protein
MVHALAQTTEPSKSGAYLLRELDAAAAGIVRESLRESTHATARVSI